VSRQCLSASGAGRALTPARHLRLGGPSPRQLANITWAPPRAPELCSPEVIRYYPASRRAIPDPRVGTHALLPLTPVPPIAGDSRDLHASSMPPTFVLSQDQTLQECLLPAPAKGRGLSRCPSSRRPNRPATIRSREPMRTGRPPSGRSQPTPHQHTLVKDPCETFPPHIHPCGCFVLLDRASPGATCIMPAMTYSRAGRTTIGPGCLSAVFGMGTGVSTRAWSPAIRVRGSPTPPGGGGVRPRCTGAAGCAGRSSCVCLQSVGHRGPCPPVSGGGAVRPNGRLLVPVG
jgi:hypothetical protein